MARPTLPSAVTSALQGEDYYETTLAQPLVISDTDIYPETMPVSEQSFGVLDPEGDAPEIVFWTSKGADFVRCPSSSDGQGRGVFQTTAQDWDQGTKFGIYSVWAFFEAIITGKAMQDGFIEPRHFSSSIDPNQWIGTGESWVFGASNSQREFTYVVTGDKSGKYSPGMRLQMPRITDTGSQCATFVAASSQYATLASPANLSFTDDFTCEAFIKLSSYTANALIIGRGTFSSAGDWGFRINSHGQIEIFGVAASTNGKIATSNQSIPLGKKVHVAATLDMSGAATTMYIDGVAVPASVANLGSGASALVQNGPLLMGKNNGSSNYFDGEMSDVRVWNTVRSAAQVKDNYIKRLNGNETNLVAYFKLNGDFGDLTANGNTLAPTGAVATTADCPYSATEYGIITKVTYATGNTTITVFTGQNLAPAENLSNISYSSAKSPYGFPVQRGRWTINSIKVSQTTQGSATSGTYYNVGSHSLMVPAGDWVLNYQSSGGAANGSGSLIYIRTLSTSNSAATDTRFNAEQYNDTAGTRFTPAYRQSDVNLTSIAPYYLLSKYIGSGTATLYDTETDFQSPAIIQAECAYL